MCEWDSRARIQHCEQKHWAPRTLLEPGSKNILHKSLVDLKKILLPHLHVKLGIMKQLEIVSSNYLCKKFRHLLEAKLKGVFVGPDIRKLTFDEDFLLTMTEVERQAWIKGHQRGLNKICNLPSKCMPFTISNRHKATSQSAIRTISSNSSYMLENRLPN
jgi:hypothetical protein